MRQNKVETQQLVVWVNQLRYPMQQVEQLSGMTRQAIWKRLRRAGKLVKRHASGGAPGVWITVNCHFCQREIRKRVKRAAHVMRHFCNEDCYYAQLATSGYHPWRQGQRLARALVAQRFALERGHVVHHKDGDNRNNNLDNLIVFASQDDHMAQHRGRKVMPLWDGATT
jgi:hypothetical protein